MRSLETPASATRASVMMRFEAIPAANSMWQWAIQPARTQTEITTSSLGLGAGNNITTASNVICISTSGENVSNTCSIANIFSATNAGGSAVFVNSDGQLHTTTSSKRFKKEIKPMNKNSE